MPPAAGIHLLAAAFLALPFLPLFWHELGSIPATHPDALEFIWTIWWNKEVLSNEAALYHTSSLFFPYGASLLLHATVEGLTLPLTALLFPLPETTIFNVACFVALVLNYLAALSLFRAILLERPRLSAALAALLALHPYFFAHLEGGQLSFLCFFPVLVALRSWIRILGATRVSAVDGVFLSLSFAALALMNLYYLYFTALLSVLFVGTAILRRTLGARSLALLAAVGGSALVLVAFKIVPMFRLTLTGSYTPNHDPSLHSGDLLSFLLPGSAQLLGFLAPQLLSGVRVNTAESGLYLGYTLLVLLALFLPSALKIAERGARSIVCGLAVAILFFTILTLGPSLQVGGHEIAPLGVYSALHALLPAFPSVPARFGIMVVLAALCLLAFGLSVRPQSARLAQLFLPVLLLEYAPLPTPPRLVTWETPALRMLREEHDIGAVYDTANVRQDAMMRQLVHHKPIAGGFLSRRPLEAERKLRNNPFVRSLMTGATPSPDRVRAGFSALGVSAVVTAKAEPSYARLIQIPWLQVWKEDERVAIFVPLWKSHEQPESTMPTD